MEHLKPIQIKYQVYYRFRKKWRKLSGFKYPLSIEKEETPAGARLYLVPLLLQKNTATARLYRVVVLNTPHERIRTEAGKRKKEKGRREKGKRQKGKEGRRQKGKGKKAEGERRQKAEGRRGKSEVRRQKAKI